MEHLENIIEFVRRFVTPEILILVILVIGTFLVFSFFIQDLFQDYFKDFRDKKKKDQEVGSSAAKEAKPKPKPRPKLRKVKNRPRLVKNTKDQESNHKRKIVEMKDKTKRKR